MKAQHGDLEISKISISRFQLERDLNEKTSSKTGQRSQENQQDCNFWKTIKQELGNVFFTNESSFYLRRFALIYGLLQIVITMLKNIQKWFKWKWI